MKRRFALLSALLLGAAAAQTESNEAAAPEVVAPTPGTDLLDTVKANLPASTTVVDDLILTLTADVPAAPAEAVAEETAPILEEAPTTASETTEAEAVVPAVIPVPTPAPKATPTINVPTIAAAPLAPVAAPKPLEVKPAVVVEEEKENTKASVKGIKKAPAASGRAPEASKAKRIKQGKAEPIARPAELPEGWSHISGQIAGSHAINLPAGSKIQLTIEAIDRKTGLHSPHLMVNWHAPSLNTNYFLNYNAGRLDHANYKYVVQAKVFDRKGKMLHMSSARQALPEHDASRLQIDMNF